ncbi:MAG: hydrogenase maturation nickel metallochaperone HypA [Lachnospiraceae bacterium]|nr:hydrogenase maturation nickel metallochaperone HypA [Lachnospiraceae bacterium]
MHELGIVFYIADKVEKVAAENNVSQIKSVTMEIGEVSTVIPEYLVDCWNWKAAKSDLLKGCELKVDLVPAVTFCEDCQQTYETVKYGKTCPNCGSGNTYLVQGDEHNIKEIEVLDENMQPGEKREEYIERDSSIETGAYMPMGDTEDIRED